MPPQLLRMIMSNGAAQALAAGGVATVMGPEGSAPTLVGITLEGAYRITRLIAEGGMSAVYEATQLRLQQRVAVKVMARELASNQEALARFRREAEVTSRLRHPHLVTVMDFGTAPAGQPYLVMEHLAGIDLDHRIRGRGRLPLATVVHLTGQLASGLAAAHDQGIVHRDLKPANVFLVELPGEPDFVKILDFGISKVRAANTQLTKAQAIIGTPNYMAPEQATGQLDEIDHRTDQWALACIAWEMLTGRAPFAGDDMSAVFYQVIHLDPPPLGKRAPEVPPAVEAVLRRALSKSVAERYPTIRDFAAALAGAAQALPAETASPTEATWISSDGRATGTTRGDRRQGRVERRRATPERAPAEARAPKAGANLDPALGADLDPALDAAVDDSFGRGRRRHVALAAVSAGLVLAGILLFRAGGPAKDSAPPATAADLRNSPAVVAPPVATAAPAPAVAAPAAVADQARLLRTGRIIAPTRSAARVARPRAAVTSVRLSDASDPFEQQRPAARPAARRQVKAHAEFANPFAP
jgi:serine/threonine protein kinase